MKSLLLTAVIMLFIGSYLIAQRQVKQDGFAVQTTVAQGTLEGTYSTITDVQHYLGIPFAAPPTGDLRWRAPQPPASWEGVRSAKTFGPRPIQKFIFDDMRFRSAGVSEDCLYLNVWTPTTKDKTNLPVLLYFHGGGNWAGSGDELRYDGEQLAREGIIVVTANYRLGVFGFLAHPELSAETEHSSGNYGLLDQVAAIQWVKDNIAAFGGNPDQITIGGESAGSIDCSMLMASPLSRDNIAGVLGQSGAAMVGGMEPATPAVAEAQGVRFLANTSYQTIAELRKAPTKDIYEAQYGATQFNFPEVIDGFFLPQSPQAIFEAGQQAQIPLMIGWTSTETAWAPAPKSAKAFQQQLEKQFEGAAAEAAQHYPPATYAQSAMNLSSDSWIVVGTWKWAQLHAQQSEAPVYRFRFDRIRPPLVGQQRKVEPLGAGHATDIEYFFNSLKLSDAYAWEEADWQTAQHMSQYLINFVKNGNPDGDQLVNWPSMNATEGAPLVMHLNQNCEVRPAEDQARLQWLEKMMTKK